MTTDMTQAQNPFGISYDPYRHLAEHYPHIAVIRIRLNDKVVGLTDGKSVVFLDERLNEVEDRNVLCHEVVHIDHGHGTCQPPEVEYMVRAETARRLIDIDELLKATQVTQDRAALARLVNVTRQTLHDRLATSSEEDRAKLWNAHPKGL
ncbi:ImmA/IrrE family metallo-endopeptidase [Arthrobacter burdickii]|uniref:IrrE N-terminal-like domain-containing protein n=1 Tax=Arthrobacter burdickii TaxID=3035920 RepID=A0ABT8K335_9MICC|nr:ImmA/IrrE family metallo-endopeptidase [Arthrobacter burdickii]MDN4611482.1 hypothetical protein [Arthrobacter burdickii]